MDGALIQLILPLKLNWLPTYRAESSLKAGDRVYAKFAGREYVGVVYRIGVESGLPASRISTLERRECPLPAISSGELRLWEFISEYYMCTLGEVYRAAYPVSKIRSENSISERLGRLKDSLAKVEQDLTRKHRDNVLQRLQARRDELIRSIERLSRRPEPKERPQSVPPKPEVLPGTMRCQSYLPLLEAVLESGDQALVLAPEKAFCEALYRSLSPLGADSVELFSSEKTAASRNRIAQRLRNCESLVALGTRSAVFLPFSRLSLIIVDDEQDPSFKQTEPAPRYNARDLAVKLAMIHGCRIILGSACPSLETHLNCLSGRYTLLEGAWSGALPVPEVIDIASERRKNGMLGPLSRKLIARIAACPEGVILLHRYEKKEDVEQQCSKIFPERDNIRVVSLQEFKSAGPQGARLVGVLQADALIRSDDFRADERCCQLVAMLGSLCPEVVIQTAVGERFSNLRSSEELLAERKRFNFPPYSRLVEIRRQGSAELLRREFLPRDSSLSSRKAALAADLESNCYIDVDPV